MDDPKANLKLLSNCMDKMHALVSDMRSHAEESGNSEAIIEMIELELNICIGIRRIRKTLDIPYDWHERPPERRIPDDKKHGRGGRTPRR